MARVRRVDNLSSLCGRKREPIKNVLNAGRILILAHEAAVTFDICTDDSSDLTFKTLCGHPKALKVEERQKINRRGTGKEFGAWLSSFG